MNICCLHRPKVAANVSTNEPHRTTDVSLLVKNVQNVILSSDRSSHREQLVAPDITSEHKSSDIFLIVHSSFNHNSYL